MINKRFPLFIIQAAILFLSLISAVSGETVNHYTSSSEVLDHFACPPVDFKSAPLWVWNTKITENDAECKSIIK